jgi:hypothetical protein
MFAALLDPRSIQWMLLLGGGLMVLGIIVWLVSLGVFEDTLVIAGTLTAASLIVHAAGCGVMLKSRYRHAGHALTFLGCILLPLNLWFYHTHGLMTLEGHLWVGGVICCAIYVATVLLTREPSFLYSVEGGITLTLVLLLGSRGAVTDVTSLSLVLVGLALVSIHAERIFPADGALLERKRFGLPLFWSGHVQLAAALITLLGSQILGIALAPHHHWFAWTWEGNMLTQTWWLASGIWLVGAYAYLYSDVVVGRTRLNAYLAAACLAGAVWQFASFCGVPDVGYPVVFAVCGLGLLVAARFLGFEHVRTFRAGGAEDSAIVGRGSAVVHSASALLLLAFLAAFLQGLSRLVTERADWPLVAALGAAVAASLAAAVLAPTIVWRRIYVAWTFALAGVGLITLNVLSDLTV